MRRKPIWLVLVGVLATGSLQCATQKQSTSDQKRGAAEKEDDSTDPEKGTDGRREKATDEQAANSDDDGRTTGDQSAQTKESSDQSPADLPYRATGPVAVVDGTEISADAYNEIVRKRHANSPRQVSKSNAKRLKTKTLESLVDKHLIERQLDASDVEVTDRAVEQEFEQFVDRFPNDEAFRSFLKMRNTSTKELKTQMRKDLRLRKLLRRRGGIEVSDSEAETYYENNPDEFRQKAKVKARHILVKTGPDASDEEIEKARKRAETLAEKAEKQETDFATLAREHSDGPSASKGGDLGYFSKAKMVQAFSDKVFAMKDGDISGPVRTKFGFHVIKREAHREARKESFEEVKAEIVETLEKKQFKRALEEYLAELKRNTDIETNPENIEVNESATTEDNPGLRRELSDEQRKKLKKKLENKTKQQGESGD